MSETTTRRKTETDLVAETIAAEKLQQLLEERQTPALNGYTQRAAVKELLLSGEYVDFNRAFLQCNRAQRLGSIINVLRHKEGLPIVDWEPVDNGGSVYALYQYAPAKIKKRWKALEKMSVSEIKEYNFNEKPKPKKKKQVKEKAKKIKK